MAVKRQLGYVPLNDIRVGSDGLRDVDKTADEYKNLVDSIRKDGVLNPIVLRELPSVDGKQLFGLVDGLQRFSAAGDAGLNEIPAHITNIEEANVLEAQIIANVQRIETKSVEYAKALRSLLNSNPLLTMAELGGRLSKGPGWINDRLGLLKLNKPIGDLVNEGKIKLTNAFALSKADPTMQNEFIDRAMTMSPGEFIPTISKAVKEHKEALRQGRPKKEGFQPVEFLQKMSSIKEERTKTEIGRQLIDAHNLKTPLEAWKMALDWVVNMDPISIGKQKQLDDERKAAAALAAEQRKQEREEIRKRVAAEYQAAQAQTQPA